MMPISYYLSKMFQTRHSKSYPRVKYNKPLCTERSGTELLYLPPDSPKVYKEEFDLVRYDILTGQRKIVRRFSRTYERVSETEPVWRLVEHYVGYPIEDRRVL